ncbi:unnamed protein product [Pelagomonas calceolata]|uniref:Ion transport domain-containing protein n=1 Tax=Pelagomonas calceolata TaxID=35677 RepID=A0A8J2SPH5_9STRA|nr:unnamed protein product [Pelagomonas calceolata]
MDDASRRDVADVVDSVPCWMAVALLTLADVVLFAWQLLPGTNAAEAQWLRGLELAINALFVCELGLRFVAAGGDFLSSTMNVFDTVVIVCAFVLCLAEFTAAPIVALRGLRILRYVCRGVRGACAASRIDAGFEMRGLVRQNSLSRGATLMVFMRRPFCVLRVASTASSSTPSTRRVASIDAQREREVAVTHPTQGRVAHRAREADLAPLHLDLTKNADAVARAVAASLEPRSKRRATAASSDGDRLLACVASLPRRSRELLERSAAEAATARAAYRAAHSAALAATPPPPSPVSSPVAAPPANKKGPPRDTDGLLAAAPRVNPMHTTSVDVEAPAPPPAVVLKLREPPAATASAPALLGLFEHALDEARARNAPPPRLAALLRGSPGLVFLKGDL